MFRSKYIYLSSSSFTASTYVNNHSYDFTSSILFPLKLKVEEWEVALTEINWNQNEKQLIGDLYVMSDIVDNTIQVGNVFPQILRIVSTPTIFVRPYYVSIAREYIDSIRIYLKLENNTSPPRNSTQNMRCTLHFRKKENWY